MKEIFQIGFRGWRKGYFLNSSSLQLQIGDWVLVSTEKGEDMGRVIKKASVGDGFSHSQEILRKATSEDMKRMEENREREREARGICQSKIEERDLPMKLVDVEYQFDGNKLIFYFISEERIDFRGLVRELASVYKTRIEMKQIGVRDQAKRMGGYGICGRPLCCATFLEDFEPITTQLAKGQHLTLIPSKISGVCGRLMCCLLFERKLYEDELKRYPRIGSKLRTEKGTGVVEKVDIFSEKVTIAHADGVVEELALPELQKGTREGRSFFRRR